jgi:murein L,D-transpeptidase YafK
MRRLMSLLPLAALSAPLQADPATPAGPARAEAASQRVRPALERDLAQQNLHFGDPVFLRAFKEEGELEVWVRHRQTGTFRHFRTWKVAAQSGTLGPKLAEGDGQVPEGFYFVPPSRMKPDSIFHLAFNIGYPNEFDRQHDRTGSFIMIHGGSVSAGCLAMTDPAIEEIYTLCDAALLHGQRFFRIHLFPFKMTTARLALEEENPWFPFWENLREGFERFECDKIPPDVTARDGRYYFSPPP